MSDNGQRKDVLRAVILEAQVTATLQGHDLGPFEPVKEITGCYQAACRACGMSVWVSHRGLKHSILADRCPGQ